MFGPRRREQAEVAVQAQKNADEVIKQGAALGSFGTLIDEVQK